MGRKRNGYPLKLERWYERKMDQLIRQWQKQANQFVQVHLKAYVTGGTKVLHDAANDDPNWANSIQQSLKLFSLTMDDTQDEKTIESLVTRWLISINNFSLQKAKRYKVTVGKEQGTIAINPLMGETILSNYTKGKIAENTALIKTMKHRYIDQLKNDIYQNINHGGGVTDISHAINYRTGMTLRHATLIANDQTGKALSQLDAYRSQKAGYTKYVWRSMEDGRVRPKHQKLDGKTFSYNDPNGGDNGQLPGEPIRCRCYAEPV